MTDAQFATIIATLAAGLSLIAAAIRFSVGRVVTALDNNSAAMLENTKSNAVLSTKIDSVATFVRERSTPPVGVPILPPGKS